ncbi:hypothetical protein Avbf_02560 [Armadillidium vulgare]|nr:hypothetical protein Avbf_02560 [Armadillidium vulgare]
MSKKVGKEAICKFKEGYVEITFDSHLKGHLYADYLNNLAIGDTILKTTFLDKDCNKGIPKLDETRRMNFRERVKPLFELWEFSASEIVKKNIRHNLRRANSLPVTEAVVSEASVSLHTMIMSLCFILLRFISSCVTIIKQENNASQSILFVHEPIETPQKLFSPNSGMTLCFLGTPLAVEFLAGAISKFNQFSSANKDTRIFMMGASMPFLHNVRKAVNQICGIHSLNNDFVGERDLPFAYVQTLFVADEYDADMQAKIKYYFSKNVKVIRNPEHKVKFDPDVPCTPFALKALPKWLDAGSNPSQVYPFLSAEVAESIVKGNKKKFANMPCLRREKFYSSDSSEFSNSLDDDDRRSNRKGRKRKTSSSQYRSTSPSHKRYCSRSNRRRSASRSSRNSVKRLRSRQSCSSKSVVEKIQERRSRSPPKKRTNVRDVKVQSIKLSQSRPPLPPPPPPPRIPPGSTFEGKDKKEQTQPDLSMDRVVHRSILLESSIQIFNTTTLREELGNDLYEEFEAAREKLCFKLEEEFHVYKTMPNLYDKFEECYEGFMQMYKIQYPNHSEEHKEKLWKEFWKSKFDFVEKTELRNRMVNLIGRFKQKVQSVPPAPSRPIKFVIHPRFKPCKSEIKMSSASDVSTAACTLPSSNASSTNRISDAYSNPTPVLSSNAPMSTSQVSDYSNFFHVPTPPPKI